MRKVWQSILRIGKPITKYMTVCSLHFTENDYFPITPETKLRRLKKNAIPSAKLPQRSHEVISRKRKAPRERINTELNNPIILNQDPGCSTASQHDAEPGCSAANPQESVLSYPSSKKLHIADKSTQTPNSPPKL
ncbi:uncharacterized protein [Diabrotica undecimpunctata]|uniref:uncharacterized protein n=1 Tax=Diabrotica undecimpunctata TaxID=50387 RepID=UPI003B640A71